MERIEDIVTGPTQHYRDGTVVPALPCPMSGWRFRLADVWAVLCGRATAVQWPHQRQKETP